MPAVQATALRDMFDPVPCPAGSQLCLVESLSRVMGPGCCQQQGLFSITMFVLLLQGHIQGMFISGSFSSTEEGALPWEEDMEFYRPHK